MMEAPFGMVVNLALLHSQAMGDPDYTKPPATSRDTPAVQRCRERAGSV